MPGKPVPPEVKAKVVRLYREGLTMDLIKQRLGRQIGRVSIRKALEEAGVTILQRQRPL